EIVEALGLEGPVDELEKIAREQRTVAEQAHVERDVHQPRWTLSEAHGLDDRGRRAPVRALEEQVLPGVALVAQEIEQGLQIEPNGVLLELALERPALFWRHRRRHRWRSPPAHFSRNPFRSTR